MDSDKDNTMLWVIAIVVLLVLIGGGVGLWYYMRTDIVVSIEPMSDTLMQNESRQFSATVRDTSGKDINTDVTWTVDNSVAGRVDSSGKFTATAASGTVLITATSVADTSKSATATISLLPSMPIFLKTGGIITAANPLYSRDREFYATTLENGNLCVKNKNNTNKWCSDAGRPNGKYFTEVQSDGNLCTYREPPAGQQKGGSVWCSRTTSNSKDNYIVMDESGKLCMYKGTGPDDNKGQIWCSL